MTAGRTGARAKRAELSRRGGVGAAAWLGAAAAALPVPAWAHHAMGGETPRTALDGVLSGLAHPVIGPDHLAFVLGVGLISALASLRWRGPAAFVSGTLAGCAAHWAGVPLALQEAWVALSLLLAGGFLLWVRAGLHTGTLTALLALAGAFHGYAYGESIFGAQSSPLGGYLFGFAAIQFAIAASAQALWLRATPERALWLQRAVGSASCALGLIFLVLSQLPS